VEVWVREGGERRRKGRRNEMGMATFFFRGDDNISYFPSQEGEKRGKANSFFTFECYDSNNKRRESRQGKARQGTRYEKETRGGEADQTRPDRSRKHHLAKGNGTERYHRKARQDKGKGKGRGNCIKPPRGVANS